VHAAAMLKFGTGAPLHSVRAGSDEGPG
jgi:hypothetical protein